MIENNYEVVKVSGDGVQDTVGFDFKIYENTDLLVIWEAKTTGVQTIKELATDYTVAISTTTEGGNCVFEAVSIPPSTVWVILASAIPNSQPQSVPTDKNLRDKALEDGYDRNCRLVQQNTEEASRSLQYPLGTASSVSAEIPAPAAGLGIKGNPAGDGWIATTFDPDAAQAASAASATAAGVSETNAAASETASAISAAAALVSENAAAASAVEAAEASVFWEDDGSESQLKVAKPIDMQTKKIINLVDPTANQDGATKKYVDDSIEAIIDWADYGGTTTAIGWSSFTTKVILTKKIGDIVYVKYTLAGTSNSVNTSFTVPYATNNDVATGGDSIGQTIDNSASKLAHGRVDFTINSNVIAFYSTASSVGWTASGGKTIRGQFWYRTA